MGGAVPAGAPATAHRAGPGPRPKNRGARQGPGPRRAPSKGAFRGARRHSHFVQLMKFVLPVAALAIVIAMGIYTAFYEADDQLTVTFANSPSLSNDRSTIFPKFTIPTPDGRMFSVMANSAEAVGSMGRQIRLRGIKADLTGTDGADIRLRANAGFLDLEAQTISISDAVQVVSDEGYEFRTEHVLIDIQKQTVYGDKPVTGTSPMGTIQANKFWVLDKGRTVRFGSGVVMNITSTEFRHRPVARPADTSLKGPLSVTIEPTPTAEPAPYGSADDTPE